MAIKLAGAMTELLIPYILEHLIDEVVPLGRLELVLLWERADDFDSHTHSAAERLGQPHRH